MPKPVGGDGGAREIRSTGSEVHRAKQKAKENLQKAQEIAEKTEHVVQGASDFKALCAQFAAREAQKAGEIHEPPASKKAAKTKPTKEAAAPPSPPAAKPKKTVSFVPGTEFVEAKPLTRTRVSTKPPETKGCLARLREIFSKALRTLLSWVSSHRSPHST